MKVTREQIKARAQELRNRKFTIKATLEMNAGARPVSSTPISSTPGAASAAHKENATGPAQNEHETPVLGKSA
jgi:hypothetical protein